MPVGAPAALAAPLRGAGRPAALCLGLAVAALCPCPARSHREPSGPRAPLAPGAPEAAAAPPDAGAGNLRSSPGWRAAGPAPGAEAPAGGPGDCQGRGSFLEALAPRGGSARELVWSLLHRGLMAPEGALALLDLDEQRAAEAVRREAASWILAVSGACAWPAACRELAASMAAADEPACPAALLLTQVQEQLEGSWVRGLAGREEAAAAAEAPARANLSGGELAVRRWGLGLLRPAPRGARPAAGEAAGAPAPAADPQPQPGGPVGALLHLDSLVQSLADPDADLLHLVREFLKAAERARGRGRFTATGFPDNLLGLMRLLHEQRSQATAASLAREAALVDFHEEQVRGLENEWAGLDAECARGGGCAGPLGELSLPVGKEGGAVRVELQGRTRKSRLAQLQARARRLSALLQHLAADHATVLPADAGALPAYWAGRVERVKRRLEGYTKEGGGFRPTVLIWTCSFGGGHWAATRAVQAYLPDYTTVVTDPSRDREYYEGDTVGNWIRRFIQPDWDETYVFNQFVLRNKIYELESTVENFQALRGWLRGDGTHFARPCAAPTCDSASKKLMRRAMLRAAPDFVITVYHMDLLPIAELCDELGGLPIMHLSTDAGVKMRDVWGQPPSYPNLRVGVPFDVPEVWPTVRPLARGQAFVSGYSVRMAFLRPLPSPEERLRERSRRRIRADARVVLVMSGSEGQSVDWPLRLADSETWDEPLHVIVVAAHNREFGSRLEGQLQPLPSPEGAQRLQGANGNVTVEVARDPRGGLGGVQSAYYLGEDEVASLMDVADVLITKAGGSTVAEAAYRGIPTVFDATSGILSWEEFNAKVFELHGRGTRMASVSDLESSVRRALRLNRTQSLVSDSASGQAIDARQRIRQEMQRMLEASARGREEE